MWCERHGCEEEECGFEHAIEDAKFDMAVEQAEIDDRLPPDWDSR